MSGAFREVSRFTYDIPRSCVANRDSQFFIGNMDNDELVEEDEPFEFDANFDELYAEHEEQSGWGKRKKKAKYNPRLKQTIRAAMRRPTT